MFRASGNPDIVIVWDERTIEHIARHGIKKEDVERVFDERVYVRKSGDEYHIIGKVPGKYIFMVVNFKEHRLLTARPATEEERKLYLKRGK